MLINITEARSERIDSGADTNAWAPPRSHARRAIRTEMIILDLAVHEMGETITRSASLVAEVVDREACWSRRSSQTRSVSMSAVSAAGCWRRLG